MSTNWVVTTAAERVTLDDAKRGETTFTVTNPGKRPDRAVFQVVPGDNADPSWFTVDQPQRQVAASGSASFLLAVQVPAGAAPGAYEVRGRVYSASEAPEESSVLSNRLVFDVKAPPAPEKKKIPLWILLVATGLVVVTVVVVTLVLTLGGGEEKALPQPAVSGPVTVPSLTQLNEAQAAFELRRVGLVPGVIKHRNDAAHADTVVEQSVAAGTKAAQGAEIGLVVAVKLGVPAPKTADNATLSAQTGKLEWDQAEPYVTHWLVTFSPGLCSVAVASPELCSFIPIGVVRTDTASYVPPLRAGIAPFASNTYSTQFHLRSAGVFQWSVAAVDDFGNVGQPSATRTATMGA
jgi:hypothetical protein